jgi:hypothetical protein
MQKKKPPDLARMIIARQARKNNILKCWGVPAKPDSVTQVELNYWLLFIVDAYSANEIRRNVYIADWDVRGKITRLKQAGKWPKPPERNLHFLDMFRLAYHFPQ